MLAQTTETENFEFDDHGYIEGLFFNQIMALNKRK